MQGVCKRNLLEQLEYAERVESLRLAKLRRLDEGLCVFKRVCGAAGLGSSVRERLARDIFDVECEPVFDAAGCESGCDAAGRESGRESAGREYGRESAGATTLTHLSTSGSDAEDDSEEAECSPGNWPSNGPVTVAGIAMELGLHDALSAGGRKGLGKAVSKAWREEHGGREPAKFRQPWGRGVRVVNAYSEGDRALIERVARGYAAQRREESV